MTSATYLCRMAELADGEAHGFDPEHSGQDSLFVVRQGGRLFGYLDQCPHYGDTPMAWRRHAYLNASGSHIVCAAHGALFRVADGVCVQGPCLGQALALVPLTINASGEVHLMRAVSATSTPDANPGVRPAGSDPSFTPLGFPDSPEPEQH